MASIVQIVVLICIGMVMIQSTNALKCHVCEGCKDEFDPNESGVSQEECAGSCLKVKSDGVVYRSCSSTSEGDRYEVKTVDGISVERFSCTSNLCNSASGVRLSMATAFACVVFAAVRKLF